MHACPYFLECALLVALFICPNFALKYELFHLFQTKSVLNPLQQPDPSIMDDTDLAGPLVFCLAFGAFLLLVSSRMF